MTLSSSVPTTDLTEAVTAVLRAALEAGPRLDVNPESLAARLAPAISARLAEAAVAAGTTAPRLAQALGGEPAADPGADVEEAQVLAALRRHPAGRTHGVTPEALSLLTGLSQATLGPTVSALVQAGELVRDAWLVRLPQPDDLLQGHRPPDEERAGESRQMVDRRAIGDRRAVGERRLFDRRNVREP